MLVNLISIAYCAMKLLPYQDDHFSKYRNESVQEIRFVTALKKLFQQQGFIS